MLLVERSGGRRQEQPPAHRPPVVPHQSAEKEPADVWFPAELHVLWGARGSVAADALIETLQLSDAAG
jgi:hypothetical protein